MSVDSVSISYIVFYTLACIGTLLLPLLVFRRSRIICMRRIRERRWNVRTDDIQEEQIIPRYSPDDPRYNPSKEEALEKKRSYMLQQLVGFSMVLHADDFVLTDNAYERNIDDACCLEGADPNIISIRNNHSALITNSNDTKKVNHLDGAHDEEQFLTSPVKICKISSQGLNRLIRTECSICLLDFQVEDHISWSPLECPHVFHHNCILQWMMTLMERNDEQRARRSQKLTIDCDIQIPCPVCRTDFIPQRTHSSSDSNHSVNFPITFE